MKKKIKILPSSRITFVYILTALIMFAILYKALPILFNYGPESINTDFDRQMSYITYNQQCLVIIVVASIFIYFLSHYLLRYINKWFKLEEKDRYKDIELIKKVRKDCYNLPYVFLILEIAIPFFIAIFFLLVTGAHQIIMITKTLTLILSLLIIISVTSFIFANRIYEKILEKTYSADSKLGYRVSLTQKIFLQILPLFITSIVIVFFVGYSKIVEEKADIYFDFYNQKIEEAFKPDRTYTVNEAKYILNNISKFDGEISKFIIDDNKQIETISGTEVDNFVKEYTIQIAQKYNGRTYAIYGVNEQGATLKLNSNKGPIYVGIMFKLDTINALKAFVLTFILLLILMIFILYIFSKALSNNLKTIATGLNNINQDNLNSNLPVVSNDEIGDLVIAFNKVQNQQKNYLEQIQNNQNMLLEQERLASLGQMIGGISHNLKTPIMSISGAAEGLSDLITEYDKSIGDPEVTNQDHHEIANDMREWIKKIRSYTAYMSDVITAVKGQAVNLSDSEQDEFSINDLIKYINILMKHELQNAHLTLELELNNLENEKIHGNINSLVQVINNLISNSIQAYKGKENEKIKLSVNKKENNLIISVADNGTGMKKNVQEKLFKEMITTKGKNGTGLGLFMSYSTIKANFNGDMSFTSEVGKGTIFYVTIPIK